MLRKIAATVMLATLAACDAPPSPAADADAEPSPATQPQAAPPSQAVPRAADTDRHQSIVFVGTSLTAGYGIGAEYAYPAVIQAKIDSAGLPFRVVNAGISGETSAGGLARIDWTLQRKVDVLVLELGANDMLRGLSVEQLKHNLRRIIDRTREKYADAEIVILGMEAAPNLGPAYVAAFRSVYRDLAEEYDAAYVPFFLEGVATVPELNQEDGIHPTAEGQRIIAETVWKRLEPVLRKRVRERA